MNFVARKFGGWISRFLSRENKKASVGTPTPIDAVRRAVQPGDVILVEGNTKFSTAIKYLTQSTWSHTTLYVGTITVDGITYHDQLIEADVSKGIIHSDLETLAKYHTRICRPVGITDTEVQKLVGYAVSRLGGSYDLRNVFDLVRYFVPVLPFPAVHRNKLLAFGSGEPTKAICSTLVAETFAQIRYPILPSINKMHTYTQRNHTHFTPRDFDVSPYFKVIKPTIEGGFDYHGFKWAPEERVSIHQS